MQPPQRGILTDPYGIGCVFCSNEEESLGHLFSSSSFSYQVWCFVYQWLGLSIVMHKSGFDHYLQHGALLRAEKLCRSRFTIWHAVSRSLWLMRNSIIFSVGSADLCEIL